MKILLMFLAIVIGLVIGGVGYNYLKKHDVISPLGGKEITIEKPLDKYTFDNLAKRKEKDSVITFGKVGKEQDLFTSRPFYFTSNEKKVSGLINIPKSPGVYPIIVMFRGFVPKDIYTPGEGGRRTAEYFASHGYITLSLDFLGYGESDAPSSDAMEERFQTYTTGLDLLSSLKNINNALKTLPDEVIADVNHVGIWGHSNGGHIALAILSITKKPYPTVLWNPVSKVFPYSILYFTDEYEDHGKGLIQLVADFEKKYDAEKYSPPNFYKNIRAPMQLHQAINDEEVPIRWSNELYDTLKKLDIDISYFTYPGENHNFNNGSWEEVVSRSSAFYSTEFTK